MFWIFGLVWLWAGATVVFGLLSIEMIVKVTNPFVPENKRIPCVLKERPIAIIFVIFFWPILLPFSIYHGMTKKKEG